MYRAASSESLTKPSLDKLISGHPIILQIKNAPEAKQVTTAAKAAVKRDSHLG